MSSITSGRDLNRRSRDVFGVFEIGQPDMITRNSALLRQCRADGERECTSGEEVADHLVFLRFESQSSAAGRTTNSYTVQTCDALRNPALD
jgi:hypothetical protein